MGFNDLETLFPTIAAQWDLARNKLLPSQVTAGTDSSFYWICKQGHSTKTSVFHKVETGGTCSTCVRATSGSKPENELLQFLANHGLKEIATHDRKIIHPYELDVVIDSEKVAIEFNGIYWHSDRVQKDSSYHYKKWQACLNQDIKLIQIWEDDWTEKQNIVKENLAIALNLHSFVAEVPVDDTQAERISPVEASDFFSAHHLRGHQPASSYFGLKAQGRIVAAISFTKRKDTLWLERFASSVIVDKGFSKLLRFAKTYFCESYASVTSIAAFADRENLTNYLYQMNGFTESTLYKPDYKYLYKHKRLRKTDSLLKELARDELLAIDKLPRVWDSGRAKYVLPLSL